MYNKQFLYLYKLQKYEEAIEELKKDTSVDFFYYNTGVCYLKLEKYEDALKYLKKSLKVNENIQKEKVYFNIAYCYVKLNNHKKALIYFNNAWALNPYDKECEKAINILLKNI